MDCCKMIQLPFYNNYDSSNVFFQLYYSIVIAKGFLIIHGIAIPISLIGKVLVDSCRAKLLWNATLPCAYTYACLKKLCARLKRM